MTLRRQGTAATIATASLVPFSIFYQAQTSFPLYPEWRSRLQIDDLALGLVFAVYICGVLAMLLIGPNLARRFGARRMLIAAVCLGLASCVLLAFSESVEVTALARGLGGLTTGIGASVGVSSVLALGGPTSRVSALFASSAVIVGSGCGALFSALVAGAREHNDVSVFGLGALVLAIGAVGIRAVPARAALTLRSPAAPRSPEPIPGSTSAPAAIGPFGVFVATFPPLGFFLALGPTLMSDVLDSRNALMLGVLGVVLYASAFAGQSLASKISGRRAIVLPLTISCASPLLVIAGVQTDSPALLLAAAMAAGSGQGMGQLIGLAGIRGTVPSRLLARITGLAFLCGYALNGVLPVVLGAVSSTAGYAVAALSLFAVMLVLAAAVSVGVIRHSRPARTAAVEVGS